MLSSGSHDGPGDRNVVSLSSDGTRRWRIGDHDLLQTPFHTVRYDERIDDTYQLYGVTGSRCFIISPETGELEYESPVR